MKQYIKPLLTENIDIKNKKSFFYSFITNTPAPRNLYLRKIKELNI